MRDCTVVRFDPAITEKRPIQVLSNKCYVLPWAGVMGAGRGTANASGRGRRGGRSGRLIRSIAASNPRSFPMEPRPSTVVLPVGFHFHRGPSTLICARLVPFGRTRGAHVYRIQDTATRASTIHRIADIFPDAKGYPARTSTQTPSQMTRTGHFVERMRAVKKAAPIRRAE